MTDILLWPHQILKPAAIEPSVVAFSRSGGVTLGGLQRVVRTDRGWWEIAYKGISLDSISQRRMWNMIATELGGMARPIAVPIWCLDSAPWPPGAVNGQLLTTHSDGSSFDDDSLYAQPAIGVTLVDALAIGATEATLRVGYGIEELAGVLFSYQHALYKTGIPTLVDGNDWTVSITPPVRAPIPAGADLEFGLPTCLVRLASDREMDSRFSAGRFDQRDVSFVEAADYWNDLALA